MFNQITPLKSLAIVLLAGILTPAYGASEVPNGGFESGSLNGWVSGGHLGGLSEVVVEDTCFSAFDTTGITLSGNYAAMMRSGQKAAAGSFSTLTSAPFTAGIGVAFNAVTQTLDKPRLDNMPVQLDVRVLAADGSELSAVGINTHTIKLNFGCPGLPTDGAFYTHFIDTRRFLNQSIRIQFVQKVKKPGVRLMTLIDDVVRFAEGESQAFSDRPLAVAGYSQSSGGRLRLDGSLSTDPVGGALEYIWRVHEETFDREGEFPCIDDLPSGRYKATLVVSNGLQTHSDDLFFVIPTIVNSSVPDPEPIPTQEEDEDEEDKPHNESSANGLLLDCSDSATEGTENSEESESSESENTENNIRSNAPSLSTTAIVWKPVSESDGNLVILTPTSMGNPGASIFSSSGALLEVGRYVGHTNGNRATYRFDRPGAGYPSPVYLSIGNNNYEVSNSSSRYN